MADINRAEIARRFYEGFDSEAARERAPMPVGVDPRKWICENWDLLMAILEWLVQLLPPGIRQIAERILDGIKRLKPVICGIPAPA